MKMAKLTSDSIRISLSRMRTTLDLPEDLLNEARSILGFKSKTDTIIFALKEIVRRQKLRDLVGMFGKVNVEIDLERSRRRPGYRSRPAK